MPVIAHISGPSGSGKTTLGEQLKKLYPSLLVKDLDEMDEQAETELFRNKLKKDYTNNDIKLLMKKRQQLLDNFIAKNKDSDIIFVGHHTEGNMELNMHTNNKLMLNTPALTSAYRAYLRSQNEKPEHRRLLKELSLDYKDAKDVINKLQQLGYKKYSPEEIIQLLKNRGIK